MDYDIRTMTKEEARVALDWAADEGWNPGLGDLEPFYASDPDGFFVAMKGNEPIGCVSAIDYDHEFGFIGFFIVKAPYRGHRVGIDLGKRAMVHLEDRNIGVDGVEAKIKNYRKYGFKLAYNNVRYEGVTAYPQPAAPTVNLKEEVSFFDILTYDTRHFPAPRPGFLSMWINPEGGAALGVLRDGALAGYGVIRPCRSGYKIGPLFADDPDIAETLFLALSATVAPNAPVYLDIPAVNPKAQWLVDKYRLKPVFKTARMYNREFPALPLENIFGVTSFELG